MSSSPSWGGTSWVVVDSGGGVDALGMVAVGSFGGADVSASAMVNLFREILCWVLRDRGSNFEEKQNLLKNQKYSPPNKTNNHKLFVIAIRCHR